MSHLNRRLTLEEVLDELFYASEAPDAEKLKDLLKVYPEYRKDIAEFAALWASHDNAEEPEYNPAYAEVSDESVSLLQSFVLNRLHELDQGKSSGPSAEDISVAKAALGQLAGASLKKAADVIGLCGSTVLLQKVLMNSINDVPKRVLGSLAAFMKISIDAMVLVIAERSAGSLRSYKSPGKPTVPQTETWESAVNGLPLTDDKKSELLSLTEEK